MADPLAGTICPAGAKGPLGEPGIPAADAPAPAEPKRRGRPRCAEEPCGNISIWVPNKLQDRILRLAKQRRQTPSEYLRDVLSQLFLGRS